MHSNTYVLLRYYKSLSTFYCFGYIFECANNFKCDGLKRVCFSFGHTSLSGDLASPSQIQVSRTRSDMFLCQVHCRDEMTAGEGKKTTAPPPACFFECGECFC